MIRSAAGTAADAEDTYVHQHELMYVRTEPWPPYNWQRRARATGGAVAVPLVCLM